MKIYRCLMQFDEEQAGEFTGYHHFANGTEGTKFQANIARNIKKYAKEKGEDMPKNNFIDKVLKEMPVELVEINCKADVIRALNMASQVL